MKRLAFFLAVLVALTGCLVALASCGNEETSSEAPAESSAVESKEESKAESVEESVEDSSEEAPAESSEEPVDESTEESSEEPVESSDEAPTTDVNLAAGKSYVISSLYPDTASASYPDEGGKSLTDGNKIPATAGYAEACWAGFNINTEDFKENGYATITVDLGAKTDVSKFVIYSGSEMIGAGIKGIKSLEILVSDDGKTFKSIGSANSVDSTTEAYITVEVIASASARYVQFRFNNNGNWMFISEVEVY